MRALVAVGMVVAGSAWAQTVPNGGFESGDLAPWTDESSTLCGFGLCEDGSSSVISSADAGVNMPEGSYGLVLTTGDQVGWQLSFGAVESAPFLVTRPRLVWEQVAENGDVALALIAYDANGAEVGAVSPDASEGVIVTQEIEIGAACGRTMTIAVRAEPTESGGWAPNTGAVVFDAFAQEGEACRAFRDDDGDGFCTNGLDLDGDGDCAGDGEPTADEQDCDDGNASVNPDAVDIPGNAIDEDCDGVDGEAGTGGGGTGTGTNMGTATGGTSTGTLTPGTVDEEDGFDDEKIRATSVCACNSQSGAAGWLAIPLLALTLGRRTRRE